MCQTVSNNYSDGRVTSVDKKCRLGNTEKRCLDSCCIRERENEMYVYLNIYSLLNADETRYIHVHVHVYRDRY